MRFFYCAERKKEKKKDDFHFYNFDSSYNFVVVLFEKGGYSGSFFFPKYFVSGHVFFEYLQKAKEPPTAKGGSVIFGNIGKLRGDPINFLRECKGKYGDLFYVTGPFGLFKPLIILSDEGREAILRGSNETMNIDKGVGRLFQVSLDFCWLVISLQFFPFSILA